MTKQAKKSPAADAKPTPDWERIETDYRAGILSLRELAAAHPGTNHVAISRRAKREGWTRDLQPKIQARADELVARQAVTPEPVTPGETARRVANDRQVIEANAHRIAEVRGEHRSEIARLRKLAVSLLAELEGMSEYRELLERLGVALRAEDENGRDKLNDLYNKILSVPGRVESGKKVAEMLRHAITMEREAYGMTVGDGENKGLPLVRMKDYTGRKPAPEVL